MEIRTVGPTAPRAEAASHPLLLPHQLAALRAMLDTERGCDDLAVGDGDSVSTRMGVLGDKPGSGKSYVVAALLLDCGHDHIPGCSAVRTRICHNMSATMAPAEDHLDPLPLNVLVVPHNIVGQWSRVLAQFGAGERATAVSRTGDLSSAVEVVAALAEGESPVRLIMVSASLYPDVCTVLRGHQRRATRVVFDEADSLRFRDGVCPARFHWFVTASVHNLFTTWRVSRGPVVALHSDGVVADDIVTGSGCNSRHIRSFFSFDCVTWSRFASRTVVITDNAFVDASFDLQPPETVLVECLAPLHTRALSGIASRDILDRLHAGDLDTALAYMHPERTDSEQNIVSAALAQFDLELDNASAELEFMQRRRYATRTQAETAVARQRAKVARIRENIQNVKDRIQGAADCLICFSHMANKTVVPCCSNSFCLSCITTWVTSASRSCPMCKRRLLTSDFLVCRDGEPASPPRDEYRSGGVAFDRLRPKIDNLDCLLRHLGSGEGSKVLFFCDNEYALENAGKRAMERAGIRAEALKGNASVINKRVREFDRASEPRALLVNCRHYGCGLNLSRATDVIIYHAVDSRMDRQIVGRAQRPPRSGVLRVWRFVYRTESPGPSM
eukprot:jgi/Tetstr1/464237/TSEL_009042.t1